MTINRLRDVFAGQALTGWLSSHEIGINFPEDCEKIELAEYCYRMADAMLIAGDHIMDDEAASGEF